MALYIVAVVLGLPLGTLFALVPLDILGSIGIHIFVGSDAEAFAMIVMWIATPVAGILLIRAMFRAGYRETHRLRLERLPRFANHPQGSRRFPARVMEFHLREHGMENHDLADALHKIGPGNIVISNAPGRLFVFHPTALEAGFEPISVVDDRDRLEALVQQALSQREPETEVDTQDSNEMTTVIPGQRFTMHQLMRLLSVYGWIPIVCYLVYRCVYSGVDVGDALFITYFVVVLAVTIVTKLMMGRQWWLVPGGLVCRDHRLWRSQMEGRLVTIENSSFLVDMSESPPFRGRVAFLVNGKLDSFRCSPAGSWGIVAGLLSDHHKPSLEELEAFLGAKMEGNR